MRAHALPPMQILVNLRLYAQVRVYLAGIATLALTGLVYAALQMVVPSATAAVAAFIGSFTVVLVAYCVYVAVHCDRLAACRLEIGDESLTVVAPTLLDFRERWFAIAAIDEFILGQRPGFWEHFGEDFGFLSPKSVLWLLAAAEESRAGLLTVRSIDGKEVVFRMIDKVFDRDAVNAVVNELARRGVKVRRIATDVD